jgi:hypothetical protein
LSLFAVVLIHKCIDVVLFSVLLLYICVSAAAADAVKEEVGTTIQLLPSRLPSVAGQRDPGGGCWATSQPTAALGREEGKGGKHGLNTAARHDAALFCTALCVRSGRLHRRTPCVPA